MQMHSPSSETGPMRDFLGTWARRGVYAFVTALRTLGFGETTIRSLPWIGRANRWTRMPRLSVASEIRPFLKPALFGMDMYRKLQNSFLTLNSHIGEVGGQAGNCRLFEATGVGTCLVTDVRSNLSDFFESDEEVVTYESPEECWEKIKFLLNNPAARDEIAARGQSRTLREHTFSERAKSVVEIIESSGE